MFESDTTEGKMAEALEQRTENADELIEPEEINVDSSGVEVEI